MKFIGTLIVFCGLLLSCGDSAPVEEVEVFQIRNIGTLSTSEYTVGKVIKLTDESDFWDLKWGSRSILISCKAKIKGGINLSEIKDEDIKVNGKKIEIYLPAPKIISFEMDPDQIHTEVVELTGLRADFSQQERTKILQKGEESIRKDMKHLNIINDAEKNAIVFVTDFYKELGFEEVIVHATDENKRNKNLDR